MNIFVLNICPNCGKTFYQSIDNCCYCGGSFDLTLYQKNWRKWRSATALQNEKAFRLIQKNTFYKPNRKLACAVIETADFAALRKIVRAGYDGWDSYDNQNIISAASSVPFPEIIAFLMERGVNFRKSDGSIFTSNLSQAIYYDFVEYARWFIEHGADFKHQEAQKSGWPLPAPVVYVQSHEMAEMLVAHGANPNLYNIVQKKIIWQGQLIAKAEHVNGFIFSVIFRNGEQKKLNIESYLRRHPAIFNDMLSNPDIAAQMQYDCGELFWNDRMGIEAHTLYNLDKE